MKEFESDIFFSFGNKNSLLEIEHRLSGKLYVTNSNQIHIEYINILNQIDIFGDLSNKNNNPFTVYGQTSDGKRFTAYQCYKRNGTTNLSKDSISTYKGDILIGTLFFGEWIDDIDSIVISSARVRFSYLEHWLNLFRTEDDYTKKGKENFTVNIEQFQTNLNVKVDKNTKLKTTSSWTKKVDFNRKLMFDVKQYLVYGFLNSISFKEYNKLNFILQNFFRTLIPQNNIFIEEQYITVSDKEVEIFTSDKHYEIEKKKVFWGDFLYTYEENTVNAILLNWFNLQEEYGRVFDILSSILNEKPFMYLEHSFLNVIQWYEGYCRIKYPTNATDISSFKAQIENIVSQITDITDKELIRDITKFSYETPLNKQLKKLFNDFNLKDILSINSAKLDSLIFYISKNRNKLTHPTKDKDINFTQLIYLNEILKYFTFMILIKTLKFNEDTHKVHDIKRNITHYYTQFIDTKMEEKDNE
jgi:hypothetical protein